MELNPNGSIYFSKGSGPGLVAPPSPQPTMTDQCEVNLLQHSCGAFNLRHIRTRNHRGGEVPQSQGGCGWNLLGVGGRGLERGRE